MKLVNIFILLFLLSTIQSIHRRKIKRHRNVNSNLNNNRRLKRRIKHKRNHSYVPLQQLNAATSLGFKQGIEYAKRQLNEHEEHDEDHHSSHALGLGTTALLLGGIDKYHTGGQTKQLKQLAEQQFAMKDSVLSLVTKEIDSLGFVNQKIIALSRRTGDMKNEITNKIQNEILYAYEKKRELLK